MYHVTVHKLREAVYGYICKAKLLKPGDHVGLAVSGGADSVALLLVMLELRKKLGIVLSVLHFNHRLRGADGDADETFVKESARQHGLEFFCESGSVACHAGENHLSLEAAGRSLRYEYFSRLLQAAELDHIATAHTLDDQAETVIQRLVRGAGTRGLSGIQPRLIEQASADGTSEKSIVRPLLDVRRKDIESYLIAKGQKWCEDKTNRDPRYSRNVIRHEILPQLERTLNRAVREVLAGTAEIALAEEEYWTAKVADLLLQVWKLRNDVSRGGGALNMAALAAHPLALRRRLTRAAAESLGLQLEFKHVEEILQLTSAECRHGASAMLPGDWLATRNGDEIRLMPSAALKTNVDYAYVLPVPGRVWIAEAGRFIEAVLVHAGDESQFDSDHALDIKLLGNWVEVRNWRPGDRFRPAHSKRPKKVKELLQERKLTGINRKLCPVVVRGTEVIWMEGYAVPLALRPEGPNQGFVILRATDA